MVIDKQIIKNPEGFVKLCLSFYRLKKNMYLFFNSKENLRGII